MLERLVIHDVVLIEKLALQFGAGLNVFTGETGAGKSILLDALGLALGERSEAGLVRNGATQASVTAEFYLPKRHAVFSLAQEQGLTVDNPVILRRVIGKDGKSRAFINDQTISIGLLKQFGENLLEIHGQFETHGLLNAATHRGLLDAFAGVTVFKKKTAVAYDVWQQAEEKQSHVKTERERAQAEEDFLRAAVSELEELSPQPGEADQLAAKRTNLQHREKITEALDTAARALEGEKGAVNALALAGKAIARIADKAVGLHELLASIDRAANETVEAAQQLDRFATDIGAEPDALQHIEERLFAMRALARKHNVPVEELQNMQKDLSSRLALLTDQSDQAAMLAKAAIEARHIYIRCAGDLSAKRKQAAQKLAKAVMAELAPLKLERAQFTVDVSPLPEDQFSSEGMDRIAFMIAANPGTLAGPLNKIASGGELSRFMLALKVVLAAADPVPVLVFDEVDSGIGGATASAVGERLAELAAHVQILTVTHSPQVAARGEHHLRVSKHVKGKQAVTEVEVLDHEARREEIARMLAGSQVTDAARQAAESLLEDMEEPVRGRAQRAVR